MSPGLALLHLLNLLLPGLLLGALTAAAAKLIWRRELADRPWRRLAAWSGAAAAAATVLGLVLLGRDGSMAAHAGSVLAAALALYAAGFRAGR